MRKVMFAIALVCLGREHACGAVARAAPAPAADLGALAPANLAKPRPKPPFDLTGTWLHDLGSRVHGVSARPYPKLTPAAQVHFDAARAKRRRRAKRTTTTSGSAGRRACRSS